MRWAALIALAVLAGCPGRGTRGEGRNDAVILVSSSVPEAELLVDDRPIGRIRDLKSGIAVSPGTHRLEVRHEGYHTRYIELTVEAGERRQLEVELAEVLP